MQAPKTLPARLLDAILKFCEPLPDVRDPTVRSQARLIAVILLAFIFIFTPLWFINPILTETLTDISTAVRLFAVISAVGVFILARRGRVRASADMLTGIGYAALWCSAAFANISPMTALRTLELFAIAAIFSTVIMPIRRAFAWWTLSLLLIPPLPLLRPDLPPRLLYGGTLVFNLAVGGAIIIVVGMLRHSEQALRAAAQAKARELDALLNHLPDYVVRFDAQFRYLFINRAAQMLLAQPAEKIIGRSPSEIFANVENESIKSAIAQGNRALETAIRTREPQRVEIKVDIEEGGTLFWFEAICVPEVDARGEVRSLIFIARDTTERRENEEALRASQALIRRIADTTPHLICVCDPKPEPNGRVDFANRALEKFFGCPPGEGVKLDRTHFIESLHPEDAARLCDYFNLRIDQPDAPETVEVRMKRHDGGWRWMRCWATSFDDPQQQTGRTLGIMTDFTEEKRMRDALIESERARAQSDAESKLNHLKNQMMIRIADQFRNPLAAIQSAGDMLERYYERLSADQRAERFAQIKAQVAHLTQLLDNMNTVLRQRAGDVHSTLQPVHLYALGEAMLHEMHARFGMAHHIAMRGDPNAEAHVNVRSLRLILQHLLDNAFLYTPAGGTVTLTVAVDDEIMLQVRDTGIGITEEDGAHIFEPFYRGRNIDERPGLGLGLSIVRAEVLAQNGFIQLISDPKIGTTFTVRLPNRRWHVSETPKA
jgi:PAS domain S-box-containing protein